MLNSLNIYKSEWLALVFRNRNQQYGAYVLRQQADGIVAKSLFIAASVFILFFVGPMLFKRNEVIEHVNPDRVIDVTTIAEPIHETKPIVEPAKGAAPKAEAPKQAVKSVSFTDNIKVVAQPVVDDPPTTADLKIAVITNTNSDGAEAPENGKAASTGTGDGTPGIGTGNGTGEEIYNMGVEEFPEFPGGMKAWSKFIERNLNYPMIAAENGVQGKVFISFVVEKDGSVSNIKVERGIGSGCDEEAIRVIKKSPKWKPGKQNNQNVRVRYNMPINYRME